MNRWVGRLARFALIIAVAVTAGGSAMAKQAVVVKLFYGGAWHDHSADLYSRDSIVINHAVLDGQTGLAPSDAELTFQNRDGRMNPDNWLSPLFGLIGQGIPIEIDVGTDVRFSGRADSWKPRRTKGNQKFDAWVSVSAHGILWRLGQGEQPKRSAMFRSFSGVAANDYVPTVYVPMEDGSGATQFASGIAGVPAYKPTGPVSFGADSAYLASQPLATFGDGAALRGFVPASVTDRWFVQMAIRVPARPDTSGGTVTLPLADFFTTGGGTVAHYRMNLQSFNPTGTSIIINRWDGAGAPLSNLTIPLTSGTLQPPEQDFFGTPAIISIGERDNAPTGTQYAFYFGLSIKALDSAFATAFTGQSGNLAEWDLTGNIGNPTYGHFGVWTDPAFSFADLNENIRAMQAWTGETAGARFTRLCREEGITSTIVGAEADTQVMGPQPTDTLLGLLSDVAVTDAGFIHDTRTAEGLTFRTGRSLYNVG